MSKWIALSLIVIGIGLIVRAFSMDSTTSFTDGTFMVEIIVGLIGGAGVIAGIIWFAVLLFMGL